MLVKVPRLKAARERAFLTRGMLAERSKVSLITIKRLEAGKTGVRFSTIWKLAGALGVKPEDLTAGEEEPERKAA